MNIGFALCGSFCTFSKVFPVMEELAKELAAAKDITPNQKSVVAQLLKAVEDLDFDAVKEVAEKIKE